MDCLGFLIGIAIWGTIGMLFIAFWNGGNNEH